MDGDDDDDDDVSSVEMDSGISNSISGAFVEVNGLNFEALESLNVLFSDATMTGVLSII